MPAAAENSLSGGAVPAPAAAASTRLRTTVVMMAIVFAATAATFLSGLYFTNKSLEDALEQDLSFAIGIADSLVGMEMELEKTKAATVAARLEVAGSVPELQGLMKEQYAAGTGITSLTVFDRGGVIAGYNEPPHEHDLDVNADVLEMVYAGKSIMSSPFYCSVQGEFIINIYTPMDAGRILAMSIPGLTFTDILSRHRLWKTGRIFMLNDEGTFVGSPDGEVVLAMEKYLTRGGADAGDADPADPAAISDGEMQGLLRTVLSTEEGVVRYSVDGATHICAYSRIDNSPMGWRVAVTVPFAESPQAGALRSQAYAAGALLAFGALAAFCLSRLIARPFREIQRQNSDLVNLNATIQAQDAALREEHGRVRLMLDATPLACRLWDRNFNLVECNEAAVKLFGLRDKREYLARYFELSPEIQPDGQTTLEKIRQSVGVAFREGKCAYEWEYRAADGSAIPCEVTMVRVPYGDDYVVAAYSRDLREQKRIHAEISRRDDLLQAVNSAADSLLRTDPDRFAETLRDCMGLIARAVGADRMYLSRNHVEDGRLRFTQRHEWVGDVRPFQGTALTTNIAYDEQSPEIRDALLGGNCVHARVRDLQPADRRLLGEQEVQTILIAPVHMQNDFWGFVGFDNCHSEELFTENEESIMRTASLQIASALLRNEMLLDLRVAAGSLQAALREAEAANNAKTSFLASMSHEMRTPLNAVIGLSELTLDGAELGEEAEGNIEKIHASGATLLAIVNDILDISKIEAGKFELIQNTYDLSSMINDAVTQNVLRIGSRPIQFVLDAGPELPARLYGDELRVKQIINNLLSNAFKYTDAGTVELGLSARRDGSDVWLTVRVADTGRGIRPADQARLFTDYTRFDSAANRMVGGTGLGLSITKSLVEMMNGGISVESEYGRGSVFTARVRQQYVDERVIGPAVAENLRRFRYSAGKRARSAKNRLKLPYARVLVVDDNVTNLDVAVGLMRPYGMRVDCVTGGQKAVDAIRAGVPRYDAVFMDHMMPGMDGMEATRLIRRLDSDYARTVPIIALTANAIAGNEKVFLAGGFQAFIPKPVDLARLDDVIRNFVRDKSRETAGDAAISPVAPEGGTAGNEIARPLESISISIPGIDAAAGAERFGGGGAFLRMLRSFAVNTPAVLDSIQEVSPQGLPAYATAVHGIKGSSRNVCAGALANQAEELERAARSGGFSLVSEKNGPFLAVARQVIAGINAALAEAESAKPLRDKPDAAALARLRSACGAFDMDGMEAAMAEIEAFRYNADGGLADRLRADMTRMDFAGVAEKLSVL